MPRHMRKLAVVTGASTGIGLELSRKCAEHDFDLIISANEAEIENVALELRRDGASVETVQSDLATLAGVDALYDKINGRPVFALLANAGRGLGGAFLDQNFEQARYIVDTNVIGTIYLIHKIGRDMRRSGDGKILITGSIAGFVPGSYQAIYSGTKAFLNSFSYALREELRDSGVTVTCLMPGVTETEYFRRAGMLDTKVATQTKDCPADVAEDGFKAMMNGDDGIISGIKSKLEVAATHLIPAETLC